MQVTAVALEEIQFLTAFIETGKAIEFINYKYTDEKQKEKAKELLQQIKPSMMGPRTLRQDLSGVEYK